MMWNSENKSITAGDDSINVIAGRDVNINVNTNASIEFVDQAIEQEVAKLRKSRFFHEYNVAESSLRLGNRLVSGNLSNGSEKLVGRALAWCARLLSRSQSVESAEQFLSLAKAKGDFAEARLADAFLLSQKGDKAAALQMLATIDTNVSRSAGMMIVAHHDGSGRALSWITEVGYSAECLDSDGKSYLINIQLQLGQWDEAAKTANSISKDDFDETPALHHLVALTTLVPTIPHEFRAIVLTQVPFEVREFPLASDSAAMMARRAAHQHFLNAVEAAKKLDLPLTSRSDEEYALWLELRDPTLNEHGKHRLEEKLRDTSSALGFVHYALKFGIKLDLDKVERDIERSIAINAGMTNDAAVARFALALTQPTPEAVASYIAHHYDQLSSYISPELMQYRQIEFLSRAGLFERANEVVSSILERGISPEQESNLRRIISEAKGKDPVEFRREKYLKTRNVSDLIGLVDTLEEQSRWVELCDFGRRLFEETHSLADAERIVTAYSKTHKSEELVDLLKRNADLMQQSHYLQMAYAWALYHEGLLLESRTALSNLSNAAGDANYRALQVNLGIALGDLASLSSYIADEYRNKDSRNAHDLIGAAQLALHIGSFHAKDLVFEAAAKANEDSAILVAAYFIATGSGWESDPRVFQWFEKATELSGDDGPIQKLSLKEVLDRKPEWDRRESEIRRLLAQGKIPLFLATKSLNQTLINAMTFPALANLMEADPRRRHPIPAFSGKRHSQNFEISQKVVSIDATALLTLSFLDILDVSLDAFETVFIPHSTLGWLFSERKEASFHQPSRIAQAHQVRDFLATGVLKRFSPSVDSNSDLSSQVGDELASLIAEAENLGSDEKDQRIVVRSSPVHRLSSLMEEEADLSAHSAVMSSCLAVVGKLKQKAAITAPEEKRAAAYLRMHEKQWPNQPEIADGATLFLDDLAISYFLHLGLLGKLQSAGLTAVASPRAIAESDALLSYERISEEVKDILERIRSSLNSRIESGKIRVGRMRGSDEFAETSVPDHPSVDILSLSTCCDASIIDDRFLNQHARIETNGARTLVLSSLDLLDALVNAGVLTDEDCLNLRTRLRQGGYFFVPIRADELKRHLLDSNIVEGKLIETAELKAIRESILRARMSDCLQLPEEAPWLDTTLKVFHHVLRELWVEGVDIKNVTARSDWIVDQIDVRGWAHRLVPENADSFVRKGRAAYIQLLLLPPSNVEQAVVDAYLKWIEERVLSPIQEQFPELYEWLVGSYRRYLVELSKEELTAGDSL